jgi:5-carboxymethyl-2-hydroxymuconate isomerase
MPNLTIEHSKGLSHVFADRVLLRKIHTFIQASQNEGKPTINAIRLKSRMYVAEDSMIGTPDMPDDFIAIEFALGDKPGRGAELRKGLGEGMKAIVIEHLQANYQLVADQHYALVANVPEVRREFYCE